MLISPYLSFDGRCEEAFKFYQSIIGGEIVAMMKARGSPMEAHCKPDQLDNIMHARLKVGDQYLMASDTPPEHQKKTQGMTVTLEPATLSEAERIFKGLSAGGTVEMAPQPTFWSSGFGMFTDKYGTPWMINCAQPPA